MLGSKRGIPRGLLSHLIECPRRLRVWQDAVCPTEDAIVVRTLATLSSSR